MKKGLAESMSKLPQYAATQKPAITSPALMQLPLKIFLSQGDDVTSFTGRTSAVLDVVGRANRIYTPLYPAFDKEAMRYAYADITIYE